MTRRSIWIAQGTTIVGLILYVLAVHLVAPILRPSGRSTAPAVGLVLALVPALLWLLLFYVQDRREPEPLVYVLRAAVAGAVLAGAVAIPAVRLATSRSGWLTAGPLTALLGSILVVGAVQEFCIYLAVRFTVYEVAEFDEIADGVTYGTAAGLGLATMVNLWFVLASPAIAPVPAALRMVVTALAHAAFGGVLGYYLGRAKILGEEARVVRGFLLAATLNGLFAFLIREVTTPGLAFRPWNGLLLAAALGAGVTLWLFRLTRLAPAPAAT